MSWRGRSRWHEGHRRSPVWEPRRSASAERRSPHRHRERRERHERHERDRERDRDRRDRYERDADRRHRYDKRERRRSPPRRYDDVPAPPTPPNISKDLDRASRSRSGSRDGELGGEKHEDHPVNAAPGDWFCKCGLYNFKRRQMCFRRSCNGKRSEGTIYEGELDRSRPDNTYGITKRLLFRRIDALTTEENILDAIKERCSKDILDSIAGITIGRETLTGASKCLAYINFNSIADSAAAHAELMKLKPPLEIERREVLISFYNEIHKPLKPISTNPADYNAYYTQMASYNASCQALSEADRVNAAAAVAQSAINAAQARHMSWAPASAPVFTHTQSAPTVKTPTGDGKTVYSPPDVRTFLYDESSGYYYDPATGLYYDGKTQYFYNSKINQYMYWDAASSSYIAATQNQNGSTIESKATDTAAEQTDSSTPTAKTEVVEKEPEEKKKRDKEDKVKVAKKIAKDMERWARTLNQKKENARSNFVKEQILDTGASKGSADIGFSVLGAGPSLSHVRELSPVAPSVSTDDFLIKKPDAMPIFDCDEGIIDWAKLTCLLCKRRFPSLDVLTKHKTMSDLHKQNLVEHRKRTELLPQTNGYRDRAAERRLKFGEDEPLIRKRYETDMTHGPIASHPPPSVVDTIGGKMLQKMGWSEGRGLGKEEQGRIAPIEAEQRPNLAGLGQKRGIYTPTPGLTYRDTVKKLMIARYREVVGQEDAD